MFLLSISIVDILDSLLALGELPVLYRHLADNLLELVCEVFIRFSPTRLYVGDMAYLCEDKPKYMIDV